METVQTSSHEAIAQGQLKGLPEEAAKQLGSDVLKLSHQSLFSVLDDMDFGPTYTHPDVASHSPEQTEAHDRVGGIIRDVGGVLADAYREVESGQRDTDSVSQRQAVFSAAKELAFQRGVEARNVTEIETAKQHFQTMFALAMIEGNTSGCDAQVRSAVAKGMGADILSAASDLHGVVAIHDRWGDEFSAPQVCERTHALLQVATDQTFDDQLQHIEPVAEDSPSPIQTKMLEESFAALDARDLTALSELKSDIQGDIQAASALAEKAGHALAKEAYGFDVKPSEVKNAVQQILRCRDEVQDEAVRKQLTDSLQAIRASRRARDQKHKSSRSFVYTIDAAMIELAADGNEEAVMALISSSRNEILPDVVSSKERNTRENLNFAFGRVDESYTDEDKSRAREMLLKCHAQKAAHLTATLRGSGAHEDTINNILAKTPDPDSAIDVPDGFWEIYCSGEYWAWQIRDRIEDILATDITRTAEDVLMLYHAGFPARDDVSGGMLDMMSVLSVEKRAEYEKSITRAMQMIKQWQAENDPDLMDIDDLFRGISEVGDPALFVQIWSRLGGSNVESAYVLATAITSRGHDNDPRRGFADFDSAKLERLDEAIDNGLPEVLQKMPSFYQRSLLLAVTNTTLEHDALAEVEELADEGLFEFGGANKYLVADCVFLKSDSKARFESIKELADEGLFELGGANNRLVLKCVFSEGESYRARFESIKELADKGLFELGGSNNNLVVRSILLNSNPEAQFESIKRLADEGLFELTDPRSGLGVMGERMLSTCLSSDDPERMFTRTKNILGGGQKSLWWLNTQYADLLLGEVHNGAATDYTVSGIPTALPVSSRDELHDNDTITFMPFADMTDEEKHLWIDPAALVENPSLLSASEVPFDSLKPDARSAFLAYRLFAAIALSRSPEEIDKASEANKSYAENRSPLELGDLVHATESAQNLRSILLSGILCGEAIGPASQKDIYPYNVDTVVVSPTVMEAENFAGRVRALKNGGHGSICIVLHRTPESTDFGKETKGGVIVDHRLVFGAIPSTEINAIVLRAANSELQDAVIDSIVDHGMYVPVYDEEEKLLLSYEDYVQRREDGNYNAVQPEVVDGSFKLDDTQEGSNEGAWYIVTSKTGRERWYVKYGDSSREASEHLWTEILADRFYAEVTPQLASETRAVIIDGRLARASKKVVANENPVVTEKAVVAEKAVVTEKAKNAGFIMDCLIGNWDAAYGKKNLIMDADGNAVRIDTGNSFDFRARGQQKETDSFGETVQEVEFGANSQSLGGGMRRRYPGLTDDDIKQQVRDLRDKLPEERIDALAKSVRLSKAKRVMLAKTIKARRRYLIEKFL
ncbi:hypothetical protein CSA80_00260 [Candidatus Saccharibacteria bacterium]|nr:MAG: hypothetical protein CSA80_00260 [Candidatus Saccharibacteria bacterium]